MLRKPKPVQPQEEDWLQRMERGLRRDIAQPGLEGLTGFAACITHPSWLVHLSDREPLAWKALQAAVAELRKQGPDAIQAAVGGPLMDWALDVAEGKRKRPRGPQGRHPMENLARDMVIAATIAAIRDLGHRPVMGASREYDGSACHLVAARRKLSYERVRDIWEKYRSRFKPGRLIEKG